MKISKQDYINLKEAIINVVVDRTYRVISEHKIKLRSDERVQNINKRFRFDLLWAIPGEERIKIMDNIYKYANDDHLDTALKHIVYDLGL